MTIKSNLSDALDSVSKALIIALEEKNEDQVVQLFELYNQVRAVTPVDFTGVSIDFSDYNVAAQAANWTNFGANHDVISFGGDTVISSKPDTISLG